MNNVSRKYTASKLYNLPIINKVKVLLFMFKCILFIGLIYLFYKNLFFPLMLKAAVHYSGDVPTFCTVFSILFSILLMLFIILTLRLFELYALPYIFRFRVSDLPLTKQECEQLGINTLSDYQKLISKKAILHSLIFNVEQFEVDIPSFVLKNIKYSTGYRFMYDSHVCYKISRIVIEQKNNSIKNEEILKWLRMHINRQLKDRTSIYFSYFDVFKATGSYKLTKCIKQIVDEEYSKYELSINSK